MRRPRSWSGWIQRSTDATRSTPRWPAVRRCRSRSGWTPGSKRRSPVAEDAWTTIEYTDAVFDDTSGQWISRAEVAEIDFTAFAAQPKADQVDGRLIVRRIPDFQADKHRANGQDGLFDVWRFHAFFTTTDPDLLDTVTADKIHRQHAIIEQVHADLKGSALAHLPSGVFTANAAWLVLAVIAFDLTRAAATLARPERIGPDPGDDGDRAAQADSDPLPDRDLSATTNPAPPAGLALADRLEPPHHQCRRPADPANHLTAGRYQRPDQEPWNTTASEASRPGAHHPAAPHQPPT